MERTDDPVRDADRYNSDMEERPIKKYKTKLTVDVWGYAYGKNAYEAESDMTNRMDALRDYIECAKGDDLEVDVIVGKIIEEVE